MRSMAPLALAVFVAAAGCRPAAEPEGHADHEGHDHEGHDDHEGPDDGHGAGVVMSDADAAAAGVAVLTAGPATLSLTLSAPGEIQVDPDRLAHVVPRVGGVARQVRKGLGDFVKAGEVLAVADSRELAEARSALATFERRLALAETTLAREQALLDRKVAAEQEFLAARHAFEEARIERDAAIERLAALGVTRSELARGSERSAAGLATYELRAPRDGVILEKHLVVGESFTPEDQLFVVGDLSLLTCEARVPARDLARVHVGQPATVSVPEQELISRGVVGQVGAVVGEDTRTALVRIAVPNPDGRWRPGLFVTVELAESATQVPVAVSHVALQQVGGKTVVFVRHGDHFEPQAVEVGMDDGVHAEVRAGLEPGARYAGRGSFLLKAELGKGEAEHVH